MTNKYGITDNRWGELCSIVKEKGLNVSANDFTASEIKIIISEARLTDNERKAAEMFFINKKKKIDISVDLNFSESTIKYHEKPVRLELKITACRVFK